MTGYLLDTNVVSESCRAAPEPRVLEFLVRQEDLWLSSIVLHELQLGLHLMSQGRRRDVIRAQLLRVNDEFGDRVIAVGPAEARLAAQFRAQRQEAGRPLHLGDALIAGTAAAHDLILATRNAKDFAGLEVVVANPWQRIQP